jgi:hypothetical protein
MARTGQREQLILLRGDIHIGAGYEQQFPVAVDLRLHDGAKGPVEFSLSVHPGGNQQPACRSNNPRHGIDEVVFQVIGALNVWTDLAPGDRPSWHSVRPGARPGGFCRGRYMLGAA